MDLGVVRHQETGSTELGNDKNGHGSVNLKQQRSGLVEESLRLNNKMARLGEDKKHGNEAFARSSFWPSGYDGGQKMLSFSSSEPHFGTGSTRSIAFSSYQDEHHSRNGGLSEGMRPFNRYIGPFTPSQWMELEHQALIYKHFVSRVPVPSNLLAPIKRSLFSYASGSYASNYLGWGSFHLGFSGSNDPEPGRCRRTDGKKWRCSRDAVPDQKYCERHINRGRHRSRKPVEGQTGQAVSGSTALKVAPIAPSSSAVSVISRNSSSNSLTTMHYQFNFSNQNNANASIGDIVNRSQDFHGLSVIPPNFNLKSKDSDQKQPVIFGDSSDFGILTTSSLVNQSREISYGNTRSSSSQLGLNEQEATDPHPVRHLTDDWPKDQSDSASLTWPEELKSDWTQLSMSLPMAPSDFSSSCNSPYHEKPAVPPLSLSRELDPIRMSLGVGNDPGVQKQFWSPFSWENSMGGPLGEVLTSTSASAGTGNISPQLDASPTGVLQTSTFVSLSNSSSGSSPRVNENKALDNASLYGNVFGPSLASSAAIPSL